MSDDPEGTNGERTFMRITNADIWRKLIDIEHNIADLADYPDTKKRIRSLELRFYGILAGLITAITVVLLTKGGTP